MAEVKTKRPSLSEDSLSKVEKARDRQVENINTQYEQRIAMLEKERDSRLQAVQRSFQHQIDSMKAALAKMPGNADQVKH